MIMPMPEFHALVNEAKKEIVEINLSDLKKMLESREDFSLIDVRQAGRRQRHDPASGERQSRHAGAQHRPGHYRQESQNRALLWRGQPFRLGSRIPKKNGFQERDFSGGWVQRMEGKHYLTI